MTRAEAHQLVDDYYADGGPDDLRLLAQHWDIAGHWNENTSKDDWYEILHEHVNDSSHNGDDDRSNGPKDSDPCDLTDMDPAAERAHEEGDHYATPWPL